MHNFKKGTADFIELVMNSDISEGAHDSNCRVNFASPIIVIYLRVSVCACTFGVLSLCLII